MGISKEFLYKSLWTTIKFAPVGVAIFYAAPIIIPITQLIWAWLPLTFSIYKMRGWIPRLDMIKYGTGSIFTFFRVKAFIKG